MIESEGAPAMPPAHLTEERQLQVWRSLRSKATEKYLLHDWYAGALAALEGSDSNPDALAQAAHSLRELLEKLPRALETEIPGPDSNTLRQKRETAATLLRAAKGKCGGRWVGQVITDEIGRTLVLFEEYSELCAWPTRKERAFGGLKKMDPMMQAFPSDLQEQKWQRYSALWKKVEDIAHHRGAASAKECADCILEVEMLVLDYLAPLTADDQDELSSIISKGTDVNEKEIDRALQLITRRGANLAFFFDAIRDPVWLGPLDRAGYFLNPPSAQPAGEGFIMFPFWWPMVFLKRVASVVPDRVVEILLKIPRTNNPRVFDGITEIAAGLPPHLATRVADLITEHIKDGYNA
jgi:hypothetical protein